MASITSMSTNAELISYIYINEISCKDILFKRSAYVPFFFSPKSCIHSLEIAFVKMNCLWLLSQEKVNLKVKKWK